MTAPILRALRGAITVDDNDAAQIRQATSEMLAAVLERNGVSADAIVSMIFTATPDLTAEFPAVAAREMGMTGIPLLCATEIDVPHAMPRCIRLMIHCTMPADQAPRHVYLREARALRADLADETEVQ